MYPTREFSVLIHQLPRPLSCQLLQTSNRLFSRPTSSPNFQMWFPPMVLQLLNLVMESLIIFSRSLVLRCSQKLDGWIQRSWHPPRRSSPPWRKQELFVVLILLGLLLFTWSRRRMEAGVLAEIIDG